MQRIINAKLKLILRQSNAWPYAIIKQRHNLDANWLNYLTQMLMYGQLPLAEARGL